MKQASTVLLCALSGAIASYILGLGLLEMSIVIGACATLPLVGVIVRYVTRENPSLPDRKRFKKLRVMAHEAAVAMMDLDPKNRVFLDARDPVFLSEHLAVMMITASIMGNKAAFEVLRPIHEDVNSLHWTKVLRNRKKAMSLRQ